MVVEDRDNDACENEIESVVGSSFGVNATAEDDAIGGATSSVDDDEDDDEDDDKYDDSSFSRAAISF